MDMTQQRFKLPASAHLFLMKDDQILLHLRKNSSFENMYGVIAGHLDGGESATSAIIREAKEEAGIDIDKNDIKIATVSHSNASHKEYVQFFFFCSKWTGKLKNMEPNKCSELTFFPVNQLPENMVPYVKKAIKCATENINYFEYEW